MAQKSVTLSTDSTAQPSPKILRPKTRKSKTANSQTEQNSVNFPDNSSIATVKYADNIVQTDKPTPAPLSEEYYPEPLPIPDEHPVTLARVITQGIQRLSDDLATYYKDEKGDRKLETEKAVIRTRRVYAQPEPFAELRPPPPLPYSFVVMLRETPTFFLLDQPSRSAERRTKEGIRVWVSNKRYLLWKSVNLEAFRSGNYSSEDPDDVHEGELEEQQKASRPVTQRKPEQEKKVEQVSTAVEEAERPPAELDGEEVDTIVDQSTEGKPEEETSNLVGQETDKVQESLNESRGLEEDVAEEKPEEGKSESQYEDGEAGKQEEIEEHKVDEEHKVEEQEEESEESKIKKQVEESKEDKPKDQPEEREPIILPKYLYRYEYIAQVDEKLDEPKEIIEQETEEIPVDLPEDEFVERYAGLVLPIVWGPKHVEEPEKAEAPAKEKGAEEDKDKTAKETVEEEREEEIPVPVEKEERAKDDTEDFLEDAGLIALERTVLGGRYIGSSESTVELPRLLTDSELKLGPLWRRKYHPLRKRFHGKILEIEDKGKVEEEEEEDDDDEEEEEIGKEVEVIEEDIKSENELAAERELKLKLAEKEIDEVQRQLDKNEKEEIRENWRKIRRAVEINLGINLRRAPEESSTSSEASSTLSEESITESVHSASAVKPVGIVESEEWEEQFWQPSFDFVGQPKCVGTQAYDDEFLKRYKSNGTYITTAKKIDNSTFVDAYDIFISFKRLVTYERKMSKTREEIVVLRSPPKIPTDIRGIETFEDILSFLHPPASNEERFRVLEKTEAFQNAVTLMERILASNGYGKQQKKFRGLISEGNYTGKITYTLELLWTFVTNSVKGKCVTSMCWNFKNDNILAVGYGKYFYEEESRGKVCCWTIKNPVYPERMYDFYAPVTSLEFSKEHPNFLAVGLYNGCLLVVDVSCNTKRIVAQNYEEDSTLENSIWQVNWYKDDFGEECLMTCTQGGNIHRYQRDRKLLGSLLMKLSNVEGNISGIPLPRKWVSRSTPSTHSPGALVFAKPILESKIYYVGTNEGGIHKCSQVHLKQHLDVFLAHAGPVYGIQFSPFCNKIFLTCGGDWTIRIWAEGINEPLIALKTKRRPVLGAIWCPKNATIIASICDQEINIWDIRRQINSPVFSLSSPTNTPNSAIQFSICGRNLIVGDRKGNVNVFSLKDMPYAPYSQTAALGQGLKKAVGKEPEKMKVLRDIEGLFPEGE